jgi:putative hemolysin
VGDIPEAGEPAELPEIQSEDGSWLVNGMMPVDAFKNLLRTGPLPDEERRSYQTATGFVMLQLGRVPAPPDRVDWGGWRFAVADMDGRRIETLPVPPAPSSGLDGEPSRRMRHVHHRSTVVHRGAASGAACACAGRPSWTCSAI